jgi:pimeloyl-ACP methyl ester carboxylesterase
MMEWRQDVSILEITRIHGVFMDTNMVRRQEGIATVNKMNIWYETFGENKSPVFLLIMGGCCQGILWPTEFCERLSRLGFFVIRYDHRDTGLSTYFDFEKSPYDITDMAKDAAGLLEYLQVDQVHLCGLSLGGPIAELMSVYYPDQVQTISLLATSCDFRPVNLAYAGLPEETHSPLSRTRKIYLDWMKKFLKMSPDNLPAQLEQRLECWRILNGRFAEFEEDLYRNLHLKFLRRQTNLEAMKHHIMVQINSENLLSSIPNQIRVPTLVMHGSQDVILPPDHGKALAAVIPHSQYLPIEGMGHVINQYFYDVILTALVQHARSHSMVNL